MGQVIRTDSSISNVAFNPRSVSGKIDSEIEEEQNFKEGNSFESGDSSSSENLDIVVSNSNFEDQCISFIDWPKA